jgi:hypothetical protein
MSGLKWSTAGSSAWRWHLGQLPHTGVFKSLDLGGYMRCCTGCCMTLMLWRYCHTPCSSGLIRRTWERWWSTAAHHSAELFVVVFHRAARLRDFIRGSSASPTRSVCECYCQRCPHVANFSLKRRRFFHMKSFYTVIGVNRTGVELKNVDGKHLFHRCVRSWCPYVHQQPHFDVVALGTI